MGTYDCVYYCQKVGDAIVTRRLTTKNAVKVLVELTLHTHALHYADKDSKKSGGNDV